MTQEEIIIEALQYYVNYLETGNPLHTKADVKAMLAAIDYGCDRYPELKAKRKASVGQIKDLSYRNMKKVLKAKKMLRKRTERNR